MFEQDPKTSKQLIIVYDKLSKPIAKNLFNTLAGKFDIVLWSKKVFLDNEAKLKNSNKVLLFDEDLIEENLSSATNKQVVSENALFIVQGNISALTINPDIYTTMPKEEIKINWRLFIPYLSLFYILDIKKKIRFKILFDAAKDFQKTCLQEFMNGTRH